MNTRSAKGVMFQSAKTPSDETRSLYHYLGILRNRRWFLAGVVSACLLLALIGSFVFTYEYRANSTIQINPERSDFYEGWRQTGSDAEYRTYYLTELEGLTSNGLSRRVIEDLQLWEHDEFTPAWKRALGLVHSENGVIETFRKRVAVSTVHESMLINVQFAASDPELASSVLNALVNRYTSEHGESQRQLPGLAADWMSEKIPALKSSLAEAERNLDAYRRKHGLIDVEGSVSRLNELELSQTSLEVAPASLELAQTRSAVAEAMRIFEDMSDPAETGERLESLDMVSNDPLVQQAWIRRSKILNNRQKLSLKYGPKHPSMIDANTRLASLDAEIAAHIDRIMSSAMMRVESLDKQLSNTQLRVDDKKQDVMSVQEKRYKLRELEGIVETQRRLLNQFYVDTIEARTLEGFDIASSIVVDAAVAPLQPYRPKRAIVLMLVALSSSIFSVLFVFIYEHVDDKLRNTRDVKDKLRMGLLGVMPEFTSPGLVVKPGKSREPARMYQHSEVVAEAVNNVRTSLMAHSSKRVREASVLLVTASQSGEGSTTAAIALAHSFARLERVLLIDCHLRRPAIGEQGAEIFADVGLNTLIAGTTSIEDSVWRNALGGRFDVLPCTPDAARSTTVLASNQFEQLLGQFRERYDVIILDAAPLRQDSSSLVLGRLADAIVYVVRSHSTRLMTILRGIRRLREAEGFVAGVLITRVDPNRVVAQGGDYDYASYCGDISYKEKNDWDIVRETLHAAAQRVRLAYRNFNAASKWNKAKSMATVLTQRARSVNGSNREADVGGLRQRSAQLKNSARNAALSVVARCRRVDCSGLRDRARAYRLTMVSTTRYIGGYTRRLSVFRLAPLCERASKALVMLRSVFARLPKPGNGQTLTRKSVVGKRKASSMESSISGVVVSDSAVPRKTPPMATTMPRASEKQALGKSTAETF